MDDFNPHTPREDLTDADRPSTRQHFLKLIHLFDASNVSATRQRSADFVSKVSMGGASPAGSGSAGAGTSASSAPFFVPAFAEHPSGGRLPARGAEVNLLAPGLVIEGKVFAEADMVIHGAVHGNVTCRGDIDLQGEVTGDVEGRNIRIRQGTVQGNVRANESLSVDNSTVAGDLYADIASINSKIDGNIRICGTLTLLRETEVKGNITAAYLHVEEGAMLTGQVTICGPQQESSGSEPSYLRVLTSRDPSSVSGASPSSGAKSDAKSAPEAKNLSGTDDAKEPHKSSAKIMAITGIFLWGLLLLHNVLTDAFRLN